MEIQTRKLDEIQIGLTRRFVRQEYIIRLAESIKEVGLLQPIVVSESNVLVAGLHRLKACMELQWESIPVVVLSGSDLDTHIAEIDENLMRFELTVMERAIALAERKKLYLAKYPETKADVAGGKARGRQQQAAMAGPAMADGVPTFTKDVSEKIGKAERTIRADIQIGESIPEKLQEAIIGSSLGDNKEGLLGLSRAITKQPDLADTILEEINQGVAVVDAVKKHIPSKNGTVKPTKVVVELDDEVEKHKDNPAIGEMAEFVREAVGFAYQTPKKSLEKISAESMAISDIWPFPADALQKLLDVYGLEQTFNEANRFVLALDYLIKLRDEFTSKLEVE